MRSFFAQLLNPLNIAGILTGLSALIFSERTPIELIGLSIWLLGFVVASLSAEKTRWRTIGFATQAISTLVLTKYAPSIQMLPVLQVVLTAQLAMMYSLRTTALIAVAISAVQYTLIAMRIDSSITGYILAFSGFQLFALMTAHYARTAELAKERLALVNADLLATRALLEQSARHGERLRVARDLHDVVGHKLTALHLNLRAMPGTEPLRNLSSEILQDIRGVVSTVRDRPGVDITTAILAAAQAFPRPRVDLNISEGAQLEDSKQAETVLRIVQEALANAAKHGEARVLSVELDRDDRLRLTIQDDGDYNPRAAEGNGMLGIRERIQDVGGTVVFDRAAQGGLRIKASMP